jgi:beta-glucuronidase
VLRRTLLAAGLALLAGTPSAQAGTPPAPLPLASGWEFAHGREAGPPRAGWRPVEVPHVANPDPTEASYRGGVGWYRLKLVGPQIPDGYRWAVRFEGARRMTKAWLDGRPLGEQRDPYTPFELDLPAMTEGRVHTLTVRTDYRRPRGMREGWWNYGGLVRRVSLVPRGAAHLEYAAVLPRRTCAPAGCQWTAIVDAEVVAGTRGAPASTVELDLTSPDGIITTASAPVRALGPGDRTRVRQEVAVAGPIRLWWPHDPALYQANIRLRTAGRIEDADRLRVGLRSVTVSGGRLTLNGRALSLRGASIQEDLPGRGSALRDQDIDRIVADVTELRADVTRAHHLLDERLLERFDERGILLWSQAPVYHRDADLAGAAGRARELESVRRTILAARRHPSVIVHSVANELSPEPDRRPGTRRFLLDAERVARDADPTLPVGLDLLAYPGYPRQATHDRFDVLGVNHYYGWYHGKPDRPTRRFAGLVPHLRALHRHHPRAALLLTEFGAEATRSGPATEKGTFAFQSRYLRRTLNVADREPYLSGAIYWTAREFAVKPRWRGGPVPAGDAIHSKGLLFRDGRRKPAWSVARDAFARTPTYR